MYYLVGRQPDGYSTAIGVRCQSRSSIFIKKGALTMSKEKSSKKEEKKKPAMTQKEKKAAKKSKNESSDFSINDKKK
jgi:hypothetical protein